MPEKDIGIGLQRLVDRQVAKRQIRSVVAGMQSSDGRLDVAAAAGHSDAGGSTAMTRDTPYYLASITKMYTATVIMKLAGIGSIDLDDPVSAYLTGELIEGIHVISGIDYSAQITVSQLLDHTSGLADYFTGEPKGGMSLVAALKGGGDRSVSVEDIVAIVRRLPPRFPPGADGGRKAYYSDTNYVLLGAIIEAVTAATVADSFQEMILGPLDLTDTFVFDHTKSQPTPATIYFRDHPLGIPLAMSSFAPDGGVVSTLADSMCFLRAFFGGSLLTEHQLASMTSGWNRIFFPLRYGSGLMLYKPPRWVSPFVAPPELIGHSGSTGSFAFHDPKRDVYLAGTVNQMDNPRRPYRLMPQMIGLLA
jgi:CubicO group peptidase (beta-lactamase class C family)